MTKTATVFGGSGFVGRYVVEKLAQQGYQVLVICRYPDHAKFLKPLGAVGQITPVHIDIFNPDALANTVKDVDVVVNLLGLLSEKGRQKFDRLHHQFPDLLGQVAARHGVKNLIQLSAIGANPGAKAKYARTKGLGEKALKKAYPDAVILRPSLIFGPEDNFFNFFAKIAKISPALPLIGGGKTKFQPVYVLDVAAAVMAAIDNKAAKGQVFELGGPKIYTFKQLLLLTLKEIRTSCVLVPFPFWVASFKAFFWEFLPWTPLTRDQVRLLKTDNVVAKGAKTLASLGLTPAALEAILPKYLIQYRRGGQWDYKGDKKAA